MTNPTPTDVHVPAPLGDDEKQRMPSRMTFLNRLYAALKERWSDGGFLSAEDFTTVFKSARGHAGGKAKAEARLQIAAEGEDVPTGCIVCLTLDAATAQALAVASGLPPEELHLTLCFFGDTDTLGPIQQAEALLAVRDAAANIAPFAGELSGIGRFTNGEQDVIYASVDAPALTELQDCITDCLEMAGMPVSEEHGFTPHITLAYVESGMPSPIDIIEPAPVSFGSIEVWFGPDHITVPLLGSEPADDDGEGLPPILQDALGADASGMPWEYLAAEASFALQCAEAPAWIPYLPKPGSYSHPRYGTITITPERNSRFVDNFTNKVYQDRLPIDAEHETKLSGAVGWITGMRVNTDGSADAAVEWTDRGRSFFKDSRFRYFSPEWYDAWEDPATRTTYSDVAIGGALTTRPFFKDPALRPLFASEQGVSIQDDSQPQGADMSDQEVQNTQSFAELQSQLDQLRTENATLKQAGESAAEQAKQTAERLAAIETERQRERFTALIKNDGARWFGETTELVAELGRFAQTFGEQSPEFASYVKRQQAVAEILRSSAAFIEIGGDGGERTETAEQKLDRQAKELAATKGISVPQAYTELLIANPSLYTA
jgi:2'-5' RNA ligase